MIRAVVFDVGETLLDDTREWRAWAEWIGVPLHTLSALVGAVTAQGRDNADALRLIRPDLDVAAERRAREAAGCGEQIADQDLYPDVRPALAELRAMGVWVGVAGNQTARAADLLRALDLPVDAVATSGEWGVAKPDPRFFARLIDWAPGAPSEILYVGDHRDNDAVPAKASGLRTALIRRGPWGYLWAEDPVTVQAADWRIDRLTELPELIKSE
ncbi:HAD family hydrolase [Actinomadura sp. NPDC047616]|uniref:HAD family hydrolase n=1 Tax=Actinomadura sp. NPDC047616 TaxID=3155914 RepID=UPI0033F7C32F